VHTSSDIYSNAIAAAVEIGLVVERDFWVVGDMLLIAGPI
jgi:hypothetical protein